MKMIVLMMMMKMMMVTVNMMTASLEDEDDCIDHDDGDGGEDLNVILVWFCRRYNLVIHLFAVERKDDQHEVFLNLKVFICSQIDGPLL